MFHTYRFLALCTEAVPALETGDLQLVSIIDEPIGALGGEVMKIRQGREEEYFNSLRAGTGHF